MGTGRGKTTGEQGVTAKERSHGCIYGVAGARSGRGWRGSKRGQKQGQEAGNPDLLRVGERERTEGPQFSEALVLSCPSAASQYLYPWASSSVNKTPNPRATRLTKLK
jgi:hypothetical protein